MPYVLIIICTMMWSLIGVLSKLACQWVDSSIIAFMRFFVGILVLGIIMLIVNRKLTWSFVSKWIWIGAAAKAVNYIFENMGVSMGHAYTQVLVSPINIAILVLISAFYFKEKISVRGWAGVFICFSGVFLVSWNGMPLNKILETNALITLLFALSALGASIHTFGQKLLVNSVEAGTMNMSMLLISAGITAIPLPFTAHTTGNFSFLALFALLALGFISGTSLYFYVKALKKVSFLMAVLIGNSGALFSLLWAKLFLNEHISSVAILGTIMFFIGITLLNIPKDLTFRKLLGARFGN